MTLWVIFLPFTAHSIKARMNALETQIDNMPSQKYKADFEVLYERGFVLTAKFISKMNGTFHDAKDLFHDALVIYHEKRQDDDFCISVAEEAYVLGIVKHLWLRKFKEDRFKVSLSEYEINITIPGDYANEAPDTKKLMDFLETFGRKCMQLLSAFYTEKKSMKDIMKEFDYRTVHSATVQKFKCLEKVRNTIKEKSIRYDDFV